MAGNIKTNSVQLGDSATATQNFTLQTNVDGTAKLARGNAGATTQDILTVDINGRVAMPNNVVAFSAYQSTLQSLPNNVFTKVSLQTKEFDNSNAFDATTNYRFQPLTAGYYQINGSYAVSGSAATVLCAIYKVLAGVSTEFKRGTQSGVATNSGAEACVSALIYLNGSTDYVELWAFQSSGASINTVNLPTQTYFQGILIAKA